jgi:peptidoglycan/xylan/chitin deacetylase (PgdA/CDA1 family)
MGTSHVHDEVDSNQLPRTINKRVTMVIALCAILVVLGSILLTSSAFWKKTPLQLTSNSTGATHSAVPVQKQISATKPVLTPTKTPVHAPVLGYPLYNGNTHLPEIALTFDDGPNPFYTPQVLAILQKYRVKATFFDVGYLVADYPHIVRQEYNQGNIVANHSWSHPVLTNLSAQAILSQLTTTNNAIRAAIGVRPTFFRPPYGATNNIVFAQARHLGYTTVLWDGSAGDWELPGVGVIITKLLSYARDGAILLLHDGGGNRAQTVAALPSIITKLKKRGYRFVTIQQLVDDLVAPTSSSAYTGALGTIFLSQVVATITHAWRRDILLWFTY